MARRPPRVPGAGQRAPPRSQARDPPRAGPALGRPTPGGSMNAARKIALAALAIVALAGCNPFATDADIVSENLSKSADQFQVLRRVVFYNGITGEYMLTIEGYCSLGNFDDAGELTVTCK